MLEGACACCAPSGAATDDDDPAAAAVGTIGLLPRQTHTQLYIATWKLSCIVL